MRAGDPNERCRAGAEDAERERLVGRPRSEGNSVWGLVRGTRGDQGAPATSSEHDRPADRRDILHGDGRPFVGRTVLAELPEEDSAVEIGAMEH